MAYIHRVNEEKHYIYVKDSSAIDIFPPSDFANELNEIVKVCTPGNPIADYMANEAMKKGIDYYNEFLQLRKKLSEQMEIVVELKAKGYPVIYPDANYYNNAYKQICDELRATGSLQPRNQHLTEDFKRCLKEVNETNLATSKKLSTSNNLETSRTK